MEARTCEALVTGKCDYCPGMYDAGDFVELAADDTVKCPSCIIWFQYVGIEGIDIQ